jgi:nucleolar protein 14
MILGPTSMKISPIPGSFPLGDMQESAGKERLSGLKLRSKLAAKCVVRKADLPSLLELGSEDASLEEQEVEQHKVDMLALNIRLIRSAAEMYSEAEAYPEIFQPLLELMKSLEASKIPKELKVSRNSQIIPRDIASSQLPN